MNRKVYFAGSIRGGRADADLYHEIIEYIKKTDVVLTEHIGDLSLSSLENESRDKAIYVQDMTWLKESDLVIAECTSPSLGVGYEMAFAEKCEKPVYILYRPSKTQLSAMLTGNEYFNIYSYETKEEAFDIIDNILGR